MAGDARRSQGADKGAGISFTRRPGCGTGAWKPRWSARWGFAAQDPRSHSGLREGRVTGWISASVRLLSRGSVPLRCWLKPQEGDILGLKYKIKSSPMYLRWVGGVPPSEQGKDELGLGKNYSLGLSDWLHLSSPRKSGQPGPELLIPVPDLFWCTMVQVCIVVGDTCIPLLKSLEAHGGCTGSPAGGRPTGRG